MATNDQVQRRIQQYGVLRQELIRDLGPVLSERPEAAEGLARFFDTLEERAEEADASMAPPPDGGLAQLVGLGNEAAGGAGRAYQPGRIKQYDDEVAPERILAVGDLYYIYQHERLGLFRAVLTLQQLFVAGAIRLSTGTGAYALHQFDRRQVLRYTERERKQAYRRVFGYTAMRPAPGAQPNTVFHGLFVQFVNSVAEFFRDKRVSEVIRPRASDPSFGSIAVVRRAGLDLRNNLEQVSYGHVNVLRLDALQLLNEAFRILGSDDVMNLFGASNAWDVLEEVLHRYHGESHVAASQRNRMAETGRNILYWLGQPYIRNTARSAFETALTQIGDDAEEWVTSAEAVGAAGRQAPLSSRAGSARLPTSRRRPQVPMPGPRLARNGRYQPMLG
jgi:hypothetical protein